ncbi:MAG: site-specific integrase, partial [Carnobacterium sp.]
MATFKQYTKKNGEKLWQFKSYLGINEFTGKQDTAEKRGYKTKKDAQMACKKIEFEYQQKKKVEKVSYTYQEVYELWIVTYEKTVKESTFSKTKEQFRLHILPVFKDIYVDKVSILKAQKFANDMFDKFVIFKQLISNASRIIEFAINLNYATTNPFDRITRPKETDEIEDDVVLNFYTRDELNRFLAIAEKELGSKKFAYFRTIAYTGLRKGEMLALTWDDVNFDEKTLRVSKTLTMGKNRRLYAGPPKTKKSKRIITIDDETLSILKRWRKEQVKLYADVGISTLRPKQLIFSNEMNEFVTLSQPRKWLDSVITTHQIKRITNHGFRHTHATLLLEAGASMKDVQE